MSQDGKRRNRLRAPGGNADVNSARIVRIQTSECGGRKGWQNEGSKSLVGGYVDLDSWNVLISERTNCFPSGPRAQVGKP